MSGISSITQRLDNLPCTSGFCGISWYYMKMLHAAGVGWAMDSMDTFLFVYCYAFIEEDLKSSYDIVLSSTQAGILGSSVFVGSFIGSFLFGNLADTFGRRPMFLWTMLIFLIGTIMCAASDSYGMLLTFRTITGIGLGGELPVASTLIQELSPKDTRGRIVVLLDGFWPLGCMLAIVLALEVTPLVGSWRIVFFLSTIPGLYALLARLSIPESPKWLASVGRLDEAKQIVHAIEKAHSVGCATNDPEHPTVAEGPQASEKAANGKNSADVAMAAADNVFLYRDLTQWQRLRLLFRGEYLKRSMVLWFLWTGLSYAYFAIYVWLPILVKGDDHDINRSTFSMLVIVASQIPGYAAAAYLVEVIGRRFGLAFFLIGSFASTILFDYITPTQVNLMIAGCFMSFFMLGAWGALYAYTPENYPTSIRAMGSAYPAGVSRLGAIGGTLIVPILFDDGRGWSVAAIMWMNSAVLIACVVVLLLFGYETRGKDIDEAIPSLMDHSGVGAIHTQTTMDDDDSMMIIEEEHRRSNKVPRVPPPSTSDSIVPVMHVQEQYHDHMMMSPSSVFIVDDDESLHYHKELPTIVPQRNMEVPPRNFRGKQLISLI